MRKLPLLLCTTAAFALGGAPSALADDGEQVLKRMTGGSIDNQLTVLPSEVGEHFSVAEHAFTAMMGFYVPAQGANGENPLTLDYDNIDGGDVEELTVARPLVNVFLYGPAVEVPETAFAHSFMDTFAAVSLDDGLTWKTTNISQSADQSSFTLGEGTQSSEDGDTEDDGEGGHHAPSLVIELDLASWSDQNKNFGKLSVAGTAEPLEQVQIVNIDTGTELFQTLAKNNTGEFEETRNVSIDEAPCRIAAKVDGVYSAPVAVTYPDGTETSCVGLEPGRITEYPGGATNVVHAVVENKVLVAWPSRYCGKGQPAYSIAYDGDDTWEPGDRAAALQTYFQNTYGSFDFGADLYLTDLFEVGGSQGSIDFADENYPQAGEVPFGCVWTARGVLLPGDDPRTEAAEASHMVWTKPERLTSGRRDPYRIEVAGVKGAGFVLTWQEDPDGLRPGQGEGPGEGWSGAVAHSKTDIWYSFIRWQDFDLVETAEDEFTPVNIADYVLPTDGGSDVDESGRPQAFVPFAVPMRVTNNARCKTIAQNEVDPDFSWCNVEAAEPYGFQDFCAYTVKVAQGQGGEIDICVNDDGLPNFANTAATRARTSLQGYSSNNDGVIDSAWVIIATEESKGLGRQAFQPDGTPCTELDPDDPNYDPDCASDIGKNQWYFSFDMGTPNTSATSGHENGLVQNLVTQGNMLNQPEVDWRTGELYPPVTSTAIFDAEGAGGVPEFNIYNTEIARRSSMLVQPIGKAGDSGLVAIPSWKQGTMRQGGPADTMLRRIVKPLGYSDGLDNNPYAFANMVCEPVGGSTGWLVQPGENPYYPGGVCGAPAINVSGVVPDTCVDDSTGGAIDCPMVEFDGTTYGTLNFDQNGDAGPILQGYLQGEGDTTRVLTWHQCPSDGAQISGDFQSVTCSEDYRDDAFANLHDQSWYNPLDVSKGHRGFLDGNLVMYMYAWSPNWRLNAKGNDRYDLYIRRSFDGGVTWTTTPASFTAGDGVTYSGEGTVACQIYRSEVTQTPQDTEPRVCYEYDANAREPARNVTQHTRMRVTTLDPRYTPTRASITETCVDDIEAGLGGVDTGWSCDDGSDLDVDLRDASRFFIVYETGDNTTVAVGEAEPLDLFYGRAEVFGDHYTVWTEIDTGFSSVDQCYPTLAYGDEGVIGTAVEGSGFCNEFDRLTRGNNVSGSEASLGATPDGSKLYSVWAQVDSDGEEAVESNAMSRRVWWIDDWISTEGNAYTLPGTTQTGQ